MGNKTNGEDLTLQLTSTDSLKPMPAAMPTAARVVADVGLSVATGLVADQVSRQMMSRGSATAVLTGLAAGVGFRAVAEGAATVVDNVRSHRSLTDGVGERMLDGLRLGVIDSGLALAAEPLQRRLHAHMSNHTRTMQFAVSGAVLGTVAGSAEAATNRATWQDGAVTGLTRVGAAAGLGAAGGFAFGGISGFIQHRAEARQVAQQLVAMADDPGQQAARGGLKRLNVGDRIQGSDIAGGIQPSILVEHDSPSVQRLLSYAREVGQDASLGTWQKVDRIQCEVQRSLRYANLNPADQGKFFALNRQYLHDAIPVGKYLDLGIADCRTFATVSQMAFQEAGVPSYFAYNRTAIAGKYRVDHAFNVVIDNGKAKVADALFTQWFNKMPLERAMTFGKWSYRVEPHPVLPFVYQNPSQNVLPSKPAI